jgi:PEGA domain-containing protein
MQTDGMRLKLAAIVMLGLPAMAAAQTVAPVTGGVAPLPPIGLPLPRIGLPLPPIGLPAAAAPQPRGVNLPVQGMRKHHRSGPFLLPAFGWPYLYESAPAASAGGSRDGAPARPEPQPLGGRLRLDVQPPGGQQLYIDGYYVGTPEDFGGEVELEAGPHSVEIQAPGYETLQVYVNIAPGRSIAYRGTLKATDATPAPDTAVPRSTPVAPATPMTGYVIPGCYIGNVPPQDAGLPASCDPSRVITIKR